MSSRNRQFRCRSSQTFAASYSGLGMVPQPKVPTFRYPGGKARLAAKIAPLFADAERYVEPFVGRGNMFFFVAVRRPYPVYSLNDKNLRFIPSIQQYAKWVGDLLTHRKHERTDYEYLKDYAKRDHVSRGIRNWKPEDSCYSSLAPDGIYASPALLLDALYSYSGSVYRGFGENGGDKAGFTGFERRVKMAAQIIWTAHPYLTFLDWRDVLAKCGPNDFVYIDPPYKDCDAGAYKPLPDADYEEMVDTLLDAKFKWALSEYDNAVYKPLTEKFGQPKMFRVKKSMSHTLAKNPAVECLWRNYGEP